MPDMCCGNKNTGMNNRSFGAHAPQVLVPGGEGTTLIEYFGGNAGDSTFFGAITKTRYKAGGITKKIYVDDADLQTYSSKNPGFLEMQNHGVNLFKLAEEEAPVPA
jgi:hypothetical protein